MGPKLGPMFLQWLSRCIMELTPGLYRHFKGNYYWLIGTATHSESGEKLVIYRALYGERGLWARPEAMWTETVDRDGYHGPRFVKVSEDDETVPDMHDSADFGL